MNPALDDLLHHPAIWRAGDLASAAVPTLSSGHHSLDQELPGGGWPLGAVTEILLDDAGIGELSLLLPALAQVTGEGKGVVWVAPPHLPYAPALETAGVAVDLCLVVSPQRQDRAGNADVLWTAEQALRSGACGAVLAWPTAPVDYRALRRLQLAAEAGGTLCFLFRPMTVANTPSPAPLRLKLAMADKHLAVHLLKRRGAGTSTQLRLALQARRWRHLNQWPDQGSGRPGSGRNVGRLAGSWSGLPDLFARLASLLPFAPDQDVRRHPGQRPVPVH